MRRPKDPRIPALKSGEYVKTHLFTAEGEIPPQNFLHTLRVHTTQTSWTPHGLRSRPCSTP